MKIPTIRDFMEYLEQKRSMIFDSIPVKILKIIKPPFADTPEGWSIYTIKLSDSTEITIKQKVGEWTKISKMSNYDSKAPVIFEHRILHLVTQDNQPMGSQRKCCEECGLALDKFPSHHFFMTERDQFTKQQVADVGYSRCIDKEK